MLLHGSPFSPFVRKVPVLAERASMVATRPDAA